MGVTWVLCSPGFALRVQLPQAVGAVQLQQLAGYVIARHPSAFTLAWDGTSAVYIKMSPEFLGWTHGLCGNNNADPQDDLVTSYGESKGRHLGGYFAGDGAWVRMGVVALARPLMSWSLMVVKTQWDEARACFQNLSCQACSQACSGPRSPQLYSIHDENPTWGCV